MNVKLFYIYFTTLH